MKENSDKNVEKKITPRSVDYSQWYLDIIDAADLAENSSVRGCMIIKPHGYALWENTQKILDKKFKDLQVQNAYFPIFIPERLITKEGEHVEGFAPEVATVTHAGGKKLDEPVVVRPTSETIIYDTFSHWIESYRDLPLLINQWANVVRWEMRTRLFLRTTEFLWQEGHTVHETEKEADDWARQMLFVYKDFAENYMAIPVVPGMKSESEKFAGAYKTYSIEAMMQDGKALQYATSHNLGQNFAKAFDVTFLDRNQERQFGWQTSWGLSTRTIGGLIMTHSDDKGLVLPPKISPIHFVITTIYKTPEEKELIDAKAKEISDQISALNYVCKIDNSDERPGEKFYKWEKKGIPVRVELGPKDVQNNQSVFVRRDTGEKVVVKNDEIEKVASEILETIQSNLLQNAKKMLVEKTKIVDSWDDFKKEIEAGNFVLAHWSGEREVEALIKEETGATIRCIPFNSLEENGTCVKSGKPSAKRVLFAKSY